MLAILACVFLWAGLWTFDPGDWPSRDQFPHNDPPANACGVAGAFVTYHVRHVVGDGAYPLVLFMTFASVMWAMKGYVSSIPQRVFGLALIVACTSASAHLLPSVNTNALHFGNGGVLGAALGHYLAEKFHGLGTVLVLGYCLLVGLLFTAEGWVLKLPGLIKRAAHASANVAQVAKAALPLPALDGGPSRLTTVVPPAKKSKRKAKKAIDVEEEEYEYEEEEEAEETSEAVVEETNETEEAPEETPPAPLVINTGKPKPKAKSKKSKRKKDDQPKLFKESKDEEPISEAPPSESETEHEPESEPAPPPVKKEPPAEAYPKMLSDWSFPSIDMLDDPEHTSTAAQESALRAQAKTLEMTLQEFRLQARVVEIDTGPVITLFELEIGAGIKVSQIASLASDIARALKAPSVRIIAPIPGKNTVGVEVPNIDKEKVRIKELMQTAGNRMDKMAIPLLLGKNASGHGLIADLAAMPHMLIAGTTGSGKSVAMNSIIMSILMARRPDMVKMILIDPKMVEMSQFKDVPHLMAPIVTDMARAEKILDWAVTKMDERYALVAEARVRNIGAYNKLGADEVYRRLQPSNDEERKQIPTHLPYIVIMIDELADLMMTAGKDVERHLARLAQKSRAVGIHIIVATQRPEAKVVTGLIKSNLPCRCAFRVASRMDSRIVLDQNGAELLMGQGDMLFLPPGSHDLIRAQGTYIEDHELHKVIDFLTDQGKAEFHPELVKIRSTGGDSETERDPLFNDAVGVVLETKRGSVSLLQRRLTIGYSRAARLIEQMAEAGIVGEYKGSQAREVVITPEEWTAMQKMQSQLDAHEDEVTDEVVAVLEPESSAVVAGQETDELVKAPKASDFDEDEEDFDEWDDDEDDDDLEEEDEEFDEDFDADEDEEDGDDVDEDFDDDELEDKAPNADVTG